ncbi:hypothetical protein [Actinophytocola sp.]|uniref:hypothetical protein n=1 Tax=Actinophytocola sp. TaxID=1872138 RepID=UPI003D6B421F
MSEEPREAGADGYQTLWDDAERLRLRRSSRYRPPIPWNKVPEFVEDDVRACLRSLGEELHPQTFQIMDMDYRFRNRLRKVSRYGLYAMMLVIPFGVAYGMIYGLSLKETVFGTPLVVAISLLVASVIVARFPFYFNDVFYREIRSAETAAMRSESEGDDRAVAASVAHAGKAARALYRSLQGSRWSWVSPPAVADRAIVLSFPLIDIDVNNQNLRQFLQVYPRYLHDAASLVMLDRVDLIPVLRDHYKPLARRSSVENPGEVPDRDIRYLAATHDHDRGRVVKDFVLPLSSWLSFLVAVAALVVALNK